MSAAAIDTEDGTELTKSCACGATYGREQWDRLQLVGEQDDGIDVWELRLCRCGSTLGIFLRPSPERMP